MADLSCASADAGAISDLEQICDEEDNFDSSASTTSGPHDHQIETLQSPDDKVAAPKLRTQHDRNPNVTAPQLKGDIDKTDRDTEISSNSQSELAKDVETPTSRNFLDLPVDLLQEIIKEVCVFLSCRLEFPHLC